MLSAFFEPDILNSPTREATNVALQVVRKEIPYGAGMMALKEQGYSLSTAHILIQRIKDIVT